MPIRIGRTATTLTLQARREDWPIVAERLALRGRADLIGPIEPALARTDTVTVRVTWPVAEAEAVLALSTAGEAPEGTT